MKIIKTISAQSGLAESENLTASHDCFYPRNSYIPLRIKTPIIHPRLAICYWGIEARCVGKFEYAIYSPSQDSWLGYEGRWSLHPVRQFMSISQIQEGISKLSGDIQFEVVGSGIFYALKIGYTVERDLVHHLCEFELPRLLSGLYTFDVTSFVGEDGWFVPFPKGFEPDVIQSAQVKPFDQAAINATVVFSPLNRIELSDRLFPNQPVQLIIDCRIPAFFSDDDVFQISRIPSVIFRVAEEQGNSRPMLEDSINGEVVSLGYSYELLFDVYCCAANSSVSNAIANQLMGYLQKVGRVYSAPHDLTIGLQVIGGKKKAQDPFLQGDVSLRLFQFKLVRLCETF